MMPNVQRDPPVFQFVPTASGHRPALRRACLLAPCAARRPPPHGPRPGRRSLPRTPGAAAARAPARGRRVTSQAERGGGREPAEVPRPEPRTAAAAGPRGSAWQPRLPGEEPRGRDGPPLSLPCLGRRCPPSLGSLPRGHLRPRFPSPGGAS